MGCTGGIKRWEVVGRSRGEDEKWAIQVDREQAQLDVLARPQVLGGK